jgi:putative membrane protein
VNQGTALPEDWARLHPLSPVVRAGRAGVALFSVVAISVINHSRPRPTDGIAIVLAAIAGFTYWWVTRWRVHGGELQINTGLFRRQQIRVPLTRIQGVDLVRPLLARIFGISELRLVLAGHDTSGARLAYLNQHRAVAVRAQLLALAHGLAHDTPEPLEQRIHAVRGHHIVAANLLSTRFAIGLILLAASITAIVKFPGAVAPILTTMLAALFGSFLATARQISAEWQFQVAGAPDGIRLRSGLLQTRAETIPHGRVQAVRWIEPLWWRPFGWVRLEFDVARRRNSERGDRQSAMTSKAFLPVGSRDEARWLLSRVLPGAVAELPGSDGIPKRAIWRVPLSRRYARLHHDQSYISCCTGRLRPDVVIIPLQKVQSIRWSQGPWARRLRLANVLIDTAGQRFTGHARCRDVDEAKELMATLPDLARDARARADAR